MKFFEITIRPDRITVRHESEERLTAGQKYVIILCAIACIAFLGFLALAAK